MGWRYQDTPESPQGYQDIPKNPQRYQDTPESPQGYQDTLESPQGYQDTPESPQGYQDTPESRSVYQNIAVGQATKPFGKWGRQTSRAACVPLNCPRVAQLIWHKLDTVLAGPLLPSAVCQPAVAGKCRGSVRPWEPLCQGVKMNNNNLVCPHMQ
ncbi:hypothetical protein Pcinc_034841 [Petrolisthes cinctipes]|uniref:Uncharacterized protein n=1 Tax=Petrolisthes cinctipes TaxID=88211 RepID=A0AAE1EPN7_PETCI|nr:hypothetical protein Pcinc_034841 [Petrolisthes cinctipes]